jgi:Arc/MetJ-type ribon-helix-helix transcriptional regulator
MTTVRLDRDMEEQLEEISKKEHISKSEIIKKALSSYLYDVKSDKNPYELGVDLFDLEGSGENDNSVRYKERLKERLHDKYSH